MGIALLSPEVSDSHLKPEKNITSTDLLKLHNMLKIKI